MFIKNIIKFLIKNYHIATILLISVFIAGYFASQTLDVAGNPSINLGVVKIKVDYSDASPQPQQVVDGVIIKIENAISDIPGIKYYDSQAYEGEGKVYAYIKDGFNTNKLKDEIKDKVDQIDDFPEDANTPEVSIKKNGNDIVYFFFYGDLPERQLRDLAVKLKDNLKTLPGIPSVYISGVSNPEITVTLSEKELQKYNISIEQISKAIQNNSLNISAGNINAKSESFKISIEGKMEEAKEFLNIPVINKDGVVVKLGQLAKIKNILQYSSHEFLVNGQPGVQIKVQKDNDVHGNNIEIAKIAIKYFNKYRKTLPQNVKTIIFDGSVEIKNSLNMLIEHGLVGLIFILIIIWLFMGSKLSYLIALAVPFSLAGALVVFKIVGMSINIPSMFGLLMVIGVVVDFGIIVAESIYVRRSAGEKPEDSTVNGTAYVFLPLLIALICNILAFIPILYLGGLLGKLLCDIPKAVIITLTISFFQSIIILPIYLRNLNIETKNHKVSILNITNKTRSAFNNALTFIKEKYGRIIYSILRWRYPIAAFSIFLLILLAALINGGIIKYVLLPSGGSVRIKAEIKVPYGTPFKTEKIIAEKLVKGWRKTADKFNKNNDPDFYKVMFVNVNMGEVNAKVFFNKPQNQTFLNQINKYWGEQVGIIPGADKSTFQVQTSVNMGDEIEVNLYGDNFDNLNKAADSLKNKLGEFKGVRNIYTSYSSGRRTFVIKLKPLANYLGISVDQIGTQIKNAFYHDEAVKIQKSKDNVSVNISYNRHRSKDSVSSLLDMLIKNSTGKPVPLKDVARISIESSPRVITRKDGKSTIIVAAGVNKSIANAAEIMSNLKKDYFPILESKYNVSFSLEGEAKESASAFGSLLIAIPISLLAMYFVLVLIFKSYIQPLPVLITIPLGVLGSFLGLYIMGLSLSMLALFGMVAMSGIVVNNSIVYVNEVNRCLAKGYTLFDAVIESAKKRFRPILLTKMCTFSGLVPLMFVQGTITQLIVPIAVVIAFGVLFTIFVTLLILPCLIYILNDIKRVSIYLWFLKKTTREEVEPSYKKIS